MIHDNNIKYMQLAIEEAKKALDAGDIPVGALIVKGDNIISAAHNETRLRKNTLKHAEIIAIEEASKILNNERLIDCDLYVTKEPCAMCAGAIILARLGRIYIAANDIKYGACGTVLSVCGNTKLNHIPEIEFGLLKEEASTLLSDFFKGLR